MFSGSCQLQFGWGSGLVDAETVMMTEKNHVCLKLRDKPMRHNKNQTQDTLCDAEREAWPQAKYQHFTSSCFSEALF